MKKFLKVLAVIIIIIVAAMFVIPLFFHNQIIEQVKVEINKNVEAKVDFEDYSLSMFRNFPNFGLSLENLSINGVDEFDGVTLAEIPDFNVSIDLFSVFGDGPYEIEKISIKNPLIHVKVLGDGKTNYDIAKLDEQETEEAVETESSPFHLQLKNFVIDNASIIYEDYITETYLEANGLFYHLSGDLSEEFTKLKIRTVINELSMNYAGIDYLKKNELEVDATFEADLKNEIYTLKNNKIRLNALLLEFTGSVGMVDEGYDLMLTFQAPKNKFRNFLSLVPAIYAKDFEQIETEGNLTLEGSVKGRYAEGRLPSYDLSINVSDAMFKYPDLPEAVKDINIFTKITNNNGQADNTVVDVRMFHFEIADNPVDILISLKTPVSDPEINADINGKFNLASFAKVYPLEVSENLNGMITSDISIDGKISDLQQENYDDFAAIGSILVKDVEYQTPEIKDKVRIKNAQLNFSPAYLDLVSMQTSIGKSDLKANGKVKNYLAYLFSEGILTADLNVSSGFLDLNTFMTDTEEEQSPVLQDTVEFTAFRVPENIHITMNASLNEMVFDEIKMSNVTGKVEIRDEKVFLHSLTSDMLGGNLTLNGSYSTSGTDYPLVDFGLKMKEFNVSESFDAFSMIRKYMPFAKKTEGNFSGDLSFNAMLNNEFMPLFSSLNANGDFEASAIKLLNFSTFNSLADTLKVNSFKSVDLKNVDVSFEIEEGKLKVKPFKLNFGNITGTLEGFTSLDQNIDYTMKLDIPRKMFGQDVDNYLSSLVDKAGLKESGISIGKSIGVDVFLKGTTNNPVVTTGFGEIFKSAGETVVDEVKEKVEEKKEEVVKMTKEEAQKILDEANEKANNIIEQAKSKAANVKAEANKAADNVRSEADKQAQALIDEAEKKGALAKLAAEKAAEKMKSEANKKADQLIEEADKQAQSIISQAEKHAANIRNEAQEKVK